MSELNERRWAVISERGREAERLAYAEAAELVRGLRGEKISGLCVITDEAARRLAPAKKPAAKSATAPAGNSKKPRRRAKKTAS